ncbi:MAG TPA: DUF1499 domain-containing protein [Gemmatimonadales bacterium]|nr:DUF1499 domain-containing protein [Gemmatimonadales bacterium]
MSRRTGLTIPLLVLFVVLFVACGSEAPRGELPSAPELMRLLAAGSGPNVAVTEDTAHDPRLRPRTYPVRPSELARAAERAIQGLPRWEVQGGRAGVIWATRRTRGFGFVDDVYLLLLPARDSTVVYARSASRAGWSDFGQNRRNLGELWDALDRTVTSEQ